MHRKIALLTLTVFSTLLFVQSFASQTNNQDAEKFCSKHSDQGFDVFFNCVFSTETTSFLNQRENTKQVEMTSMAENTTSLVDQTASPDILGLALNLLGQQTKLDTGNNVSGAVTFSAYSVYAHVARKDILDPAFYNSHRNFRRFSFTVGHDQGSTSAPQSKPATILGAKILILNGRDASTEANRRALAALSKEIQKSGSTAFAKAAFETRIYLYDVYASKNGLLSYGSSSRFTEEFVALYERVTNGDLLSPLLSNLSDKERGDIRSIILARLVDNEESRSEITSRFKADDPNNPETVFNKIRRKPQLSFTFQSKLRNGNDPDDYRAGLLFDYGLLNRMNLTINGTYDYKKSHIIGGDQKGGRFAVESNFQLTPNKTLAGVKNPFLFSIAGEGKWLNATKPTYTGQAKITIPIYDGVSFPISVSYGNRPDLVQGNYVRGNFGLTFDLGKLLAERMKNQ